MYARLLAGDTSAATRVLALITWPLAGLYGLAIAARNAAFDLGVPPWRAHRAGVPVISVGNLSAGGTGKSVVVRALARAALARGWRPAVLMRGHGGALGDPRDPRAGDEGLEFLDALGEHAHLVTLPDRVAGAAQARAAGANLLLLDDGFQHRRLARDVDLVLLDLLEPPGARHLLPRGLRRESERALARATAVFLTRADLAPPAAAAAWRERLARLGFTGPICATAHQPARLQPLLGGAPLPPEALRGREVTLVSGIGNPDAFAATVTRLGARVLAHLVRPDHHRWAPADLAALAALAPPDALVITTGKDAVKLRRLAPPPSLHALEVDLAFPEGDDGLTLLLDRVAPLFLGQA